MTNPFSSTLCAVVAATFVLGPVGAAFAQDTTNKQTADKAASTTRGPILKVKPDTVHLNRVARSPRPARKGGTSRGPSAASCYVHIDNQTPYYVDVYMDGTFIGTVSPWGDSYANEPTGAHTLYGSAPGTDLHWGPRSCYLDDSYTWTMNN